MGILKFLLKMIFGGKKQRRSRRGRPPVPGANYHKPANTRKREKAWAKQGTYKEPKH